MASRDHVCSLGLDSSSIKASLIISVYKDAFKLDCILQALRLQTFQQFEVIVSEDGEDPEMGHLLAPYIAANKSLHHLTQPDLGFRKNCALNRAIKHARSDLLIFIDGDCVPHTHFISAHITASHLGAVSTGRRVELGPRYSDKLMANPSLIKSLSNTYKYLAWLPAMQLDGIKNPESGIRLSWLHRYTSRKTLSIVGCNFSCDKKALTAINGFNEEYTAPGIGEDSDIEWRLIRAGYRVQNIKFLAPLFHLHHARGYELSQKNVDIYDRTKSADEWFCRRGLMESA